MSTSPLHSQLNSPKSPVPVTSPKKQIGLNKEDSSPGRKSPEKCSICLCPPENRCYTDSCYHEFCFVCLLEWSKVKAECPLCKQKFRNIIHNIRSESDFDEYEVKQATAVAPNEFGFDDNGRRFRYNSTMTFERMELLRHIRQMQLRLDHMQRHQDVPNVARRQTERLNRLRHLYVRSAERRERLTATTDFRRMIYDRGLRVREDPNEERIRDTSSEFFRQNPAMTHRLIYWLRRELGVLLSSNLTRINFVVEFILHLITNYDINGEEFKRRLGSTLLQNTEQFCHEFYHFARSPYDMDEYDRRAQYEPTINEENATEIVTLSPSPPHNVRQIVAETAQRAQNPSSLSSMIQPSFEETPIQHARRLDRFLGDLRRDVEMARARLEDLRTASTAMFNDRLTTSSHSSSTSTITQSFLGGPLTLTYSTTHRPAPTSAVEEGTHSNNHLANVQSSYKRAFPFETQHYNLRSKNRRFNDVGNDYAGTSTDFIPFQTQGSTLRSQNDRTGLSRGTFGDEARNLRIFDLDSSSDSSSSANSPIIVVGGQENEINRNFHRLNEPMFGFDRRILNSSPPYLQEISFVSSSSDSSPVISMSSSPHNLLNVSSSPVGRFSTPASPDDDDDGPISPGVETTPYSAVSYTNEHSSPWERPLLDRLNSSQSDDIEILAVLKPKAMRTPEVIKLDDDSSDGYDSDKPGTSGYVPPKKVVSHRAQPIVYSPISSGSDDEFVSRPAKKFLLNGRTTLRSVIANSMLSPTSSSSTTIKSTSVASRTSDTVSRSDFSTTSSATRSVKRRHEGESSDSREVKKRHKHSHEHRHRHKKSSKTKKLKRDKEKHEKSHHSSTSKHEKRKRSERPHSPTPN